MVAQDRDLHSPAEGLSPAQTHHSAEEGILPACLAVTVAAAGAQGGPGGLVVLEVLAVLEACGCSEPWKLEASEKHLGEGDLSGRGMAGREGAAAGVAWGRGMGQKEERMEEDQVVEKSQVERMEVLLLAGRSLG